jgi:hypothetical protein
MCRRLGRAEDRHRFRRVAIRINQVGAGYLAGFSRALAVRIR